MAEATASSSETAPARPARRRRPSLQELGRHLQGEAGLARAPGSREGDQPGASTRVRTSSSSWSRPMKVADWAGRLFGERRVVERAQGGNSAGRPVDVELEDVLGAAEVLETVEAEILAATRQPGAIAHQCSRPFPRAESGRRRRPPPPGRHGGRRGRPGLCSSPTPHRMDAHPHTDLLACGPLMGAEGPLHLGSPPPHRRSARRTRRRTHLPGFRSPSRHGRRSRPG